MPLYEYKCSSCGFVFEVLQKVTELPIKKCLKCRGDVKKVISAPAIQFKGNGWYVTDYARKDDRKKKPAPKVQAKDGKTSENKKPSTPVASDK